MGIPILDDISRILVTCLPLFYDPNPETKKAAAESYTHARSRYDALCDDDQRVVRRLMAEFVLMIGELKAEEVLSR